MGEFTVTVEVEESSWKRLCDALNDDSDLFVVGNFSVEKGGKKAKYVCESVEDMMIQHLLDATQLLLRKALEE